MHRSIKSDKVNRGNGWCDRQDGVWREEKGKNGASNWSSPRPSFLYEGLRLPKKFNLWGTSLAKSVVVLATVSFFLSMLEVLHGGILAIVEAPAGEEPIS